jgi:hypothetical protein
VDDEILGTNLDATAETGEMETNAGSVVEDDCNNDISADARCSSSVWYTFAPDATDTYTIETCDMGTDVDTVLGVWTGTAPASLTEVTSNDDACVGGFGGNGSQVTFLATAGVTYYIEITGFVAGQGMFYLRAYQGPAHPAPAPEPDTFIPKGGSLPAERFDGGTTTSGPRHSASFAFTSDADGASFQCSLDGAPFSGCSSPVSFDGLAGTHDFAVRSVDSGTPDPTPAVQRFTVDRTAPDTAIASGPNDPTASPDVTFQAHSSERAPFDEYRCGLDSQPTALTGTGCSSSKSFIGLCNRTHTFQTAALDPANNLDPTPATASFTETGGSACGAPEFGSLTATAFSPTLETLTIPIDPHGDGGALTVDYGTTPAYGSHLDERVSPDATHGDTDLDYLTPGTLYHYRVILTTPDGTADSGDLTFTTAPRVDPLPTVSVGTPVIVGNHAAAIPLVVDPGNQLAAYGVFLEDRGATTPESPIVEADDEVLPGSGPVAKVLDLVDLDPGTYHLRGVVQQDGLPSEDIMGPDITFSIPPAAPAGPPAPAPPLPPVQKFKFLRGFIKVGKIRHGSKTITLVISHLPPGTNVGATMRATVKGHASASKVKLLGRGHAKANKLGVARVKVKLGRKARKVLRSRRTKSVSLQVRVKPPGDRTSSITLRRKLKRR